MLKRAIAIATAGAALVAGSAASAQDSFARPWGWGWDHMMFGGITMVVFWGGIILLVVLLVRHFGARDVGPPVRPSALDILQERFARGEIDEQEYRQRRQTLQG